jgi:hypothetical protein
MTRQQVGDRLLDMAAADPDLLVGLDFGFSLPAWFLDANRIETARELWSDTGRLEGWLTECKPPFWGRPGRPRPHTPTERQWRQTELLITPRPKSVFQVGGAGTVGTASLRGMPVLHRLHQAGFSVWPFDAFDGGRPAQPTVVEAWPRLAIGSTIKSSPTGRRRWLSDPTRRDAIPAPFSALCEASSDAFDAVATALALLRSPPRPRITDPIVRREGWIWDPGRGSRTGHGVPSDHADSR